MERHLESSRSMSPRRACIASLLVALPAMALAFAGAGSAAPPGSSDLRVTKTASAPSVRVGATVTYTIQVENLGPDAATGVVVTDPLPKGADYLSATTTAGSCSTQGQRVVCAIGTLEAGAAAKVRAATVTLAVIPRKAGALVNTVSVKADQQDPVAANDQATVTTQVLAAATKATCRGLQANIVGTSGADSLSGTVGRDVIAARGGNDTIAALAGRDVVCAGGGRDRVSAGPAADSVFGGGGSDRIFGRAGADRLRGGRGFDLCRGGAGVDSIRGCER
jgi:uncharacterized repeat protein (TIGR01451 family)